MLIICATAFMVQSARWLSVALCKSGRLAEGPAAALTACFESGPAAGGRQPSRTLSVRLMLSDDVRAIATYKIGILPATQTSVIGPQYWQTKPNLCVREMIKFVRTVAAYACSRYVHL